MKENTKTLNEKREEILAEMKLIGDKLVTEKRNITQEENEQLSNLDRTQEDYAAKIETMSKIEHINNLSSEETRTKIISSPYHQGAKPYAAKEEREKALAGWFFHGSPKQKPEFWRAAERSGIDVSNPTMRFDMVPWEERVMVTSSATAGGDLVFPDLSFSRNLDVALKYTGSLFNVATVVDTATGAALPYPLLDDLAATAEVTGEGSGIGSQDMVIAQNTLHALKVDSKFIKVSWELLQDSVLPLADIISKQAGERIARKINKDILQDGNGVTGIQNIMDNMPLGVQSASTIAAGPTYADLVAMEESIDYAYQSAPGVGWLFSQSFRAKLKGMVDDDGRPLMNSALEGIAMGIPHSLLSYPYTINNGVAAWGATGSGSGAAGNKVALFGDLKRIIIRRVTGGEGGYNLLRLNERFADNGIVAFLVWGRFDAILSDNSTHPLKYFEAPNS